MGGSGGQRQLRHGRQRALAQLERIYEGPLEGLDIAPDFYRKLSSPELRKTPIGRSLQLQQQLLGEVSAGLGGRAFGRGKGPGAGTLPPDLVSSIQNELTSAQGAAGTEGSPAAALTAALRFSGASEAIRAQRIQSAQAVLGQVGGASLLPSASEFLQTGAQRAVSAANVEMQMSQAEANLKAQKQQSFYQGAGQILGIGAGLLTGGLTSGVGAAAGAAGGSGYLMNQGGGRFAGLGAKNTYFDPQTGKSFPIFFGGAPTGSSNYQPFAYGTSRSFSDYSDPYRNLG